MSTGARIDLEVATRIAIKAEAAFKPYCHRVQIVGSVRRNRPTVGDLEVVVIPKFEQEPDPSKPQLNLFDPPAMRDVNLLAKFLRSTTYLRVLQVGSADRVEGTLKDDARQWALEHVPTGLKIDVFLVTPERWGVTVLIRTGPDVFSRGALAHWKQITHGGYSEEAILRNGAGVPQQTPEEEDVFKLLRVPWVEPNRRDTFRWR